MKKLLIVYWTMSGNTEDMARLVQEGAADAGAQVVVKHVSDTDKEELYEYDCVALGCSSMGMEELDPQMEEFVTSIEGMVSGMRMGLFGSYGWGNGQWMRNWVERMKKCGAEVVGDGLIAQEEPDGEEIKRCAAYGKELVS